MPRDYDRDVTEKPAEEPVEPAYAHLYRGLPPVKRHRPRNLVIVGVLVVIACSPVVLSVYQWYSSGSGGDAHSAELIGGAFIVGGLVGFVFGRGWWSMGALYVGSFVFLIAALPSSGFSYGLAWTSSRDTAAWFQWILGVSAGAGIRALIHRYRLSHPDAWPEPGFLNERLTGEAKQVTHGKQVTREPSSGIPLR